MDNNEITQNSNNRYSYYFKEILQWVQAILVAVAVALLLRAFLLEPVEVDGHSMDNTLNNGQRLILYKLGYRFSPPKSGDIIVLEVQEGVFKYIPFLNSLPFFRNSNKFTPEIDYIKRVIGMPGDIIDLKDGYVYINGIKLEEPYTVGKTYKKTMEFPVVVPENKVFVMGDNREYSSDSRFTDIGFIDYSKIKGKAVFRYWPLKEFGGI